MEKNILEDMQNFQDEKISEIKAIASSKVCPSDDLPKNELDKKND